jgi:D-3-phosphoglycerate dehydrogenase / 2-oxoglutarate reductase
MEVHDVAAFKVVVTDQVFPDVEIERELIESAGGRLEVASGDRDQVLASVADADALLNTYFAMDAAAISRLTRCRIIARYGIGVDNVDVEAARTAGISVTNVPDYCVEEVATHTVAHMLALVRRLPQGDTLVRGGGWGAASLGPMRRLSSLTVGFLGYGRIARYVEHILSAWGPRIIVHDPYLDAASGVDTVALEELFATSDILSVHCPLTPQTRGLVSGRTLALMKPTAVLVNTSRGPIVELADLVAALRQGALGGAGLDVFDVEPPASELVLAVPNLLLTPHSAFSSVEAIKESQRKAATQVLKALAGEELDYRVA